MDRMTKTLNQKKTADNLADVKSIKIVSPQELREK